MFYVGLDIHSTRISVCVLNETGQVVRRDESRTALAAVYRIYTEGFTTPDLVEAAALLEALA